MGTLHSEMPISLINGQITDRQILARISKLESQMWVNGANVMQLSQGKLNTDFSRCIRKHYKNSFIKVFPILL